MSKLDLARQHIRDNYLADETRLARQLITQTQLLEPERNAISGDAKTLIETIRASARPGLMEGFLAEYGLATEEGIALMSLAESLLRVPDSATVDMLIEDKVGSGDWASHFGNSSSSLVNFLTSALNLTSDVLGAPDIGPMAPLQNAIKRLGEPVIRTATSQAMRTLGGQFVFSRTIEEAMKHAQPLEKTGYRFSYDMLGEAARTAEDAARYMRAYEHAISALSARSRPGHLHDNPGISVKLSALHPRYEFAKRKQVAPILVDRILTLAKMAKTADMSFNIDAEEVERLDLSLDIIEAVLSNPNLKGWNGFGIVVQAYDKRVVPMIDWLTVLARKLDRKIMVRLVKGAYWDAEIKRAQVLGLKGFPVYTRKALTDISYMVAARKLFEAEDVIYPQFATHNAHTAAAVLHLAEQYTRGPDSFEFQRLHGMGEQLHETLRANSDARCRIYAPVGPHKELLAYLVRRLLENGANASFIHQISDDNTPAEQVAADPISKILALGDNFPNPVITQPKDLFGANRVNASGWDISDPVTVDQIETARRKFLTHKWRSTPLIVEQTTNSREKNIINPAIPNEIVGTVTEATPDDVEAALGAASEGFSNWSSRSSSERGKLLRKAADLYQANAPEFFALLAREAGKTLSDAISELREAVDCLRYYADQIETQSKENKARGVFACISPWNFPLAIFTGQIAAALAAGNAVIAKPAEFTPLVATRAVELMHQAGIPVAAIQLLPGRGSVIGDALTGDPRIAGVCFTGSLPTAHRVDQSMASGLMPDAPLIAETGGLNAMVLDSTALPEQAVRDILVSAFQSAGQRCSALRILYVQQDAWERTIHMLKGAMDELSLGDPWQLSTDVGPVINAAAKTKITSHVKKFRAAGKLVKQIDAPKDGTFIAPAILKVSGIEEIGEEVFGPVLHIATFEANQFDDVIEAINKSGYGLTFGMHTRISSRVHKVSRQIKAGNIYINRNQIGAVVGSQPFGGEGLSGTGPKAGGPAYLPRFQLSKDSPQTSSSLSLPGPTGETNILSLHPRGTLLCLGPRKSDFAIQETMAKSTGNIAQIADNNFDIKTLSSDQTIDAALYFANDDTLKTIRLSLSQREGAIMPLITSSAQSQRLLVERHVCIDTTVPGGNASLLAASADDH